MDPNARGLRSYRKRLGHRHSRDPVKTWGKDRHLHAKERSLRRNKPADILTADSIQDWETGLLFKPPSLLYLSCSPRHRISQISDWTGPTLHSPVHVLQEPQELRRGSPRRAQDRRV